jgi:hypothetical protein
MLRPHAYVVTLSLVVDLACVPKSVVPVNETGNDTGLIAYPLAFTVPRSVDVLFVIDNSASMAPAQARLASAIDVLIDALELADADYRIAITTTDHGNPWCSSPATGGQLLTSSCTSRLDDFVLDGGVVDAQGLACTELCTLTPAELEIQPSTTAVDSNPTPRPWIENIADQTNLLPGTDVAEALRCLVPQGIAGCEFESPLESMYLALSRSLLPDDANYGFHRVDALLLVVFVSDEADCSNAPEWEQIFAVDGQKTFWSDPDASVPTSAVCWNAGVVCEGDPAGYDSCEPADKTADGQLEPGFGEAVLHPLLRYLDLLGDLENQAQAFDSRLELVVALIGGVDEAGVALYADASDPIFQDGYGIGPGCVGTNPLDPDVPQRAIPPVRMRALIDYFTDASLYSICADSYVDTLASVAANVTSQLRPSCYTQCAGDTNPAPGLQPECIIERSAAGLSDSAEVPECTREAGAYVLDPDTGYAQLPTLQDDVCVVMRTDPDGSTADPLDDMSAECLDQNSNLEFEIVHRRGVPDPPATAYSSLCTSADFPDVSCPGIGQ